MKGGYRQTKYVVSPLTKFLSLNNIGGHMTKKILLVVALVGVFIFIISGCATIIKGTNQNISIQSNPSNAKVVVKTTGGIEVFNGVTPASAKLPKKKEYVVTVTLDGYKEETVMISQSFEAWTIGNIICGGIIGLIVDAVDGAMWKLEPDQIMVTMATASLENGETRLYAVFYALDSNGQLRSTAIPMIKDTKFTSVK